MAHQTLPSGGGYMGNTTLLGPRRECPTRLKEPACDGRIAMWLSQQRIRCRGGASGVPEERTGLAEGEGGGRRPQAGSQGGPEGGRAPAAAAAAAARRLL
jgi:hypothetical protein